MCFYLIFILHSICFQPYDLTVICVPLPPLHLYHIPLDSVPLAFHASRSLRFAPTFPLRYTFTTQKRARSHTSCSFSNPCFHTNSSICLSADIHYGATVLFPTILVIIQLQSFPARTSEIERFSLHTGAGFDAL